MGNPSTIIVITEEYKKQSEGFTQYLLQLGHSLQGAKVKYYRLREFFSFLESVGVQEIKQIQTVHINDFYNYIRSRPGKTKEGGALTQKTVYDIMRALQLFFNMLYDKGSIKTHLASIVKYPCPGTYKERTVLLQEEVKQLLEVCKMPHERAILALGYGCGLRVSEMVQCNIEDVKLQENILIVPRGKGNKRRTVPMSAGVAKELGDYFFNERVHYNTITQKAFIVHSKGGRMQKYTLNKILKEIIKRTKSEKIQEKQISIHNLRHSIATHLLEQGVKVEQVRQFLGHSQLESTEIYTRVSQKLLRKL
jgi:integrase/recombinase XerD